VAGRSGAASAGTWTNDTRRGVEATAATSERRRKRRREKGGGEIMTGVYRSEPDVEKISH
jgi:hypothetical protein